MIENTRTQPENLALFGAQLWIDKSIEGVVIDISIRQVSYGV